jgi:hypothetical protein
MACTVAWGVGVSWFIWEGGRLGDCAFGEKNTITEIRVTPSLLLNFGKKLIKARFRGREEDT